jgi:predicted amidophosphoribosyltransferase
VSASRLLDGLLDLVFPKRCVTCRAAGAWLCEPCAGGLTPLPDMRCRRCGAPGDWSRRPCPECGGGDVHFAAASAAFIYDGAARDLVTACKFRALRSIVDELVRRAAPAFAAACTADPEGPAPFAGRVGAGAALRPGRAAATGPGVPLADVLVTWVPGHRGHTLERGFNQAELLARGLARTGGMTTAPLLRRAVHGARQSGLDRAARAANVRHAFALRENENRVLDRFKRVVIVDDVYTTGETLNHCAEVLAQIDLRPHVFTFARTVRAPSSAGRLRNTLQKEHRR